MRHVADSSCRTLPRQFPVTPPQLNAKRLFDAPTNSISISDLPDMFVRKPKRARDLRNYAPGAGGWSKASLQRCKIHGVFSLPEGANISVADNYVNKKIGGRSAPKIVPDKIRELRQRLGINQKVLAEHLGVGQNTISDWENGLYEPSPMALMAIGRVDIGNELWWYEQAGPQYADRFKTVQAVYRLRAERAAKEAQKCSWDPEFMKSLIEAVDIELKKRKKRLPIDKYAELIVIFYEHFYETRKWDSAFAEPLLRIA